MKSIFQFILITLISIHGYTQSTFGLKGTEIGVDLAANGSNLGGNVGIGLKYGVNLGEYLILGPSVRYEYLWWKNTLYNTNEAVGSRHVYGGGIFAHARFFNAVFLGAEFEMLRSPYYKVQTNNGEFSPTPTWAPTLFLGGGFSMEFNETVRVNAGIMYDVINAVNSPFRKSYLPTTDANGNVRYVPIIYRIAFFFPLTRKE